VKRFRERYDEFSMALCIRYAIEDMTESRPMVMRETWQAR